MRFGYQEVRGMESSIYVDPHLAWVEEVWLKGKSLWQTHIPQNCSWSWRKILKLKPIARSLLSFKVGDALTTKDKMCLWGFTSSSVCLFCHGFQESKGHLFFSCSFSRRIWHVLMAACSFDDPPVTWDDVISWFKEEMRGKSLKSCLCKLCLGATVYHLWKQRNNLLHGNIPLSEEAIVAQIRWKVQARLMAKGSMKYAESNLDLVQS